MKRCCLEFKRFALKRQKDLKLNMSVCGKKMDLIQRLTLNNLQIRIIMSKHMTSCKLKTKLLKTNSNLDS